jgi:hypothetical protein
MTKVSGEQRLAILQKIEERLATGTPNVVAIFRESHNVVMIDEPLTIHVPVYHQGTRPKCVLCETLVQTDQDRCKLPQCRNHRYCVPCFAVLQSTVREGYDTECVNRCQPRNGCWREWSIRS